MFILKYVPELAGCPAAFLHEPWQMTAMEQAMYGLRLGVDYPEPIVSLARAHRQARERLWAFRKQPEVKAEGERIVKRHVVPGGSRRTGGSGTDRTI